jgi:hypothetical protein
MDVESGADAAWGVRDYAQWLRAEVARMIDATNQLDGAVTRGSQRLRQLRSYYYIVRFHILHDELGLLERHHRLAGCLDAAAETTEVLDRAIATLARVEEVYRSLASFRRQVAEDRQSPRFPGEPGQELWYICEELEADAGELEASAARILGTPLPGESRRIITLKLASSQALAQIGEVIRAEVSMDRIACGWEASDLLIIREYGTQARHAGLPIRRPIEDAKNAAYQFKDACFTGSDSIEEAFRLLNQQLATLWEAAVADTEFWQLAGDTLQAEITGQAEWGAADDWMHRARKEIGDVVTYLGFAGILLAHVEAVPFGNGHWIVDPLQYRARSTL